MFSNVPHRTIFRFSITGMILASLGGMAATRLVPAYQEQEAAHAVREHGGVVYYSWLLDDRIAPVRRSMRFPRFHGWFIPGDSRIDSILLMGCTDDSLDDTIQHLGSATTIRHLSLANSGISDASLSHLSHYAHLRSLDLYDTKTTDECARRYLTGLKQLDWLDVRRTHITREGCAILRQELPNTFIETDYEAIE